MGKRPPLLHRFLPVDTTTAVGTRGQRLPAHWVSNDLEGLKGSAQYTALQESIDGRAALVVTAAASESMVAAVFFREVDPDVEGLRLTISADCQDSAGQQDALKLFRSIAFAAVGVVL